MLYRMPLMSALGLMLAANVSSALGTMVASDLTNACQRLLDNGDDIQCVAYIQGYVAGAEQAVIGEQPTQQTSSDFFQRAVRTRLGNATQVNAKGHIYCIPADEPFSAMAEKIVATGEEAETAAAVMESVLKQHYPCEG